MKLQNPGTAEERSLSCENLNFLRGHISTLSYQIMKEMSLSNFTADMTITGRGCLIPSDLISGFECSEEAELEISKPVFPLPLTFPLPSSALPQLSCACEQLLGRRGARSMLEDGREEKRSMKGFRGGHRRRADLVLCIGQVSPAALGLHNPGAAV